MARQSDFAKMLAEAEAHIKQWEGRRDWIREAMAKPAGRPKREKAAKGKRAPLTLDSLGS